MSIVERQNVSRRLRQYDSRHVDQCRTARYIVVVHTQHLIVAVLIYTPDTLRVAIQRRRSRCAVVPASRDAVDSHILKVCMPRQRGNVATERGETDDSTVRANSLRIRWVTPCSYLSIIRGTHLETVDHQRVIGCQNRLTPLSSTGLLIANEPVSLGTLRRPRENNCIVCQTVCCQAIRLHAVRDSLNYYIIDKRRSDINGCSQHLDSHELALTRISGERYNELVIYIAGQHDGIQSYEVSRIFQSRHYTYYQRCVLRSVLIIVACIEFQTHALQANQLRQNDILVLRIITYLRSEVTELASAMCIFRIVRQDRRITVTILDSAPAEETALEVLLNRSHSGTLGSESNRCAILADSSRILGITLRSYLSFVDRRMIQALEQEGICSSKYYCPVFSTLLAITNSPCGLRTNRIPGQFDRRGSNRRIKCCEVLRRCTRRNNPLLEVDRHLRQEASAIRSVRAILIACRAGSSRNTEPSGRYAITGSRLVDSNQQVSTSVLIHLIELDVHHLILDGQGFVRSHLSQRSKRHVSSHRRILHFAYIDIETSVAEVMSRQRAGIERQSLNRIPLDSV